MRSMMYDMRCRGTIDTAPRLLMLPGGACVSSRGSSVPAGAESWFSLLCMSDLIKPCLFWFLKSKCRQLNTPVRVS